MKKIFVFSILVLLLLCSRGQFAMSQEIKPSVYHGAEDSTVYYKYNADKIIYHPGALISSITRTWYHSGYIIFYSPNKDNEVEVIEFWSDKEAKVLKDVGADESPWFKYHLDDKGWFYLDEIHIYSVKRDIN